MTIILDCTELHKNPIQTGIQRVVRELLRHWPAGAERLVAARFDPSIGLVALDDAALSLLLDQDHAGAMGHASLRDALRSLPDGQSLDPTPRELVCIPEVFFDPARAAYHEVRQRACPASLAVISYDFLPWLRPELFGLRTAAPLMAYLRLVRDARHVAFISRLTQREYAARILRSPEHRAGPVLPLGADGLRMERQAWSRERCDFVALGSIDGRKNQRRILEAFETLWERGSRARLTFVGRAFEGEDRTWLHAAARHPGFRWIEHPDDATVAATLRGARATIYVSAAEGFGLPPVESLHVGIPTIATATIPSVEMLQTGGHIVLPAAEPSLIAEAVSALMDDHRAETLWREAAAVRLSTWKDFGTSAASWLGAIRGRAGYDPARDEFAA